MRRKKRFYVPQSSYVYGKEGEKFIDHVLHFETLDTEFENLTKSYNLNITLSKEPINARGADDSTRVSHINNFFCT